MSEKIVKAWEDIKAEIARLGGTNRFKRPATDKQIATLEKKVGFSLPEEVVAYLKVHNGSPDFLEELLINRPFLSTTEIARDWKVNCETFDDLGADIKKSISQCWWHPRMIPIAGADGDCICVDSLTGKVHSHVHDSGLGKPIAKSLTAWLQSIAKRLKKGEGELEDDKVIIDHI